MGDRTAFFYGTLMASEVLHRVCYGTSTLSKHSLQSLTTTPAILPHHRRSKVKYCDYPGVIPDPSSSVRGTYVTGLTEGDIYRLNVFEGPQYELRDVTVYPLIKEGDAVTGEGNVRGEAVKTSTYIWVASEEELEHEEWDYATFREEKLKNWVGRDTSEYDEVDEAFDGKATGTWAEDGNDNGADPTGGRGFGGDISKALEEEHAKGKEDRTEESEPLRSAV